MTLWTFLAVIIVAGSLFEYLKHKDKHRSEAAAYARQDYEAIQLEMEKLKKRIQNLEAIAANDPSGFKSSRESMDYDLDNEFEVKENQRKISELAQQKRMRS